MQYPLVMLKGKKWCKKKKKKKKGGAWKTLDMVLVEWGNGAHCRETERGKFED